MKKILGVLLIVLIFTMSLGIFAACGKDVHVRFASENGYECENKTVINTQNGAKSIYWEITQNNEVVAYIVPHYATSGEFAMYQGRLYFDVYIPYCDTTNFVLKVNDVEIEKPTLGWRVPFYITTEEKFNREMPRYLYTPETVYKKSVDISIDGLDATKIRNAEVKFVLNNSTYFALSNSGLDDRVIVKRDNLTTLIDLGYDISITNEMFVVNSIDTIFEVAMIKLKATDTFAFYCAVDREGFAKCYLNSYNSQVNVLTSDMPPQEGCISYKAEARTVLFGSNKRDLYNYQVRPFYGLYYIS